MVVTEPGSGLSTGLIPPGASVMQIPLSLTTASGIEPQTVRLSELRAGAYTIYLLPRRAGGDFRVTASGLALNSPVFSDARSGSTGGCEWLYLLLNVDLAGDGLLTFGELQGPFALASIPRFVGEGVESDCPPPAPITAQVGGIQASATPEPPASPTTVPPPAAQPTAAPTDVPPALPTEAPTSVPTQAAPTSVPATSTPAGQEVEEPPPQPTTVPEPTAVPPRQRPNIDIGHVEESVGAGSLPAGPLFVAMSAIGVGLAALRRRRGGPR
jgi:hypothetical protein